MKNLKLRVAGSNLLMKCYELWGADATIMNWSETYTALQQGTVDGQENPLPAIDAASVQEVQKYVSLWNANYDCLFFCINQKLYDSLTPEQQAVVDEAGRRQLLTSVRSTVQAMRRFWIAGRLRTVWRC